MADELIYKSDARRAILKADPSLSYVIDEVKAVDAVEVGAIRSWLYEMAMNNTDNYLCKACEEIVSRLDGLLAFAKMDSPQITEQTKDALMKMGEKAHSDGNGYKR